MRTEVVDRVALGGRPVASDVPDVHRQPVATDSTPRAGTRLRRRQRRLIRFILVALVAVLIVTVGYGTLVFRPQLLLSTSNPVIEVEGAGAEIGERFPFVRGETYGGDSLTIDPGQGAMIIGFIAHWCSHCQSDIEALEASVATGEFDPEAVTFISTRHLPLLSWPPEQGLGLDQLGDRVLVDTDASLAQFFGIRGTPQWIFIDEDGVISDTAFGSLSPSELSRRSDAVRTNNEREGG